MTDEQPKRLGPVAIGVGTGVVLTLGFMMSVHGAVADARERLQTPELNKPAVAIADQAEVGYCTPRFKEVLERVLHSCGLVSGEGGRRGCQPADVKTFASI